MSLTLNMVGGGGGGLSATDALLRVQAPAGSTVTITKGTVTKTDLGHENADDNSVYDYYFIIHQSQFDSDNPWNIEATDGVDTATAQIVINAADEYDITLSYGVLYRVGDQSGWTNIPWKADANATPAAATIAYNSNNMTISQNTGNSSINYHNDKVDLTNYSTLYCTVSSWASNSNPFNGLYVLNSITTTSPYSTSCVAQKAKSSTSGQTLSINVSSLSGEYYIGIGTCKTQSVNTVAVVTGVWLE